MRTYRPILAVAMAVIMILAIGSIAIAKPQGDKPASNCENPQMHKVSDQCACNATQTCDGQCQCCKEDRDKDKDRDNKCPKPDNEKRFGSISGCVAVDTTTTTTTISCPLAHAHLRLLNCDCKVVRAAQSDKKGCFEFKNVKPGTYTLCAFLKGYKLTNKVSVTVTAGGKVSNICIHFTKCPKKPSCKCTKK